VIKNLKKTVFLLIILSICSCKSKNSINENNIVEMKLFENKIEGTDFFISLPENYTITVISDVFFVCYINTNKFSAGGVSVGTINMSSEVSLVADSEDYFFIENLINKIFDVDREWKIYAIKERFIAEVIIEYKTKWGEYLHFYVFRPNKEEVYKVINLFSTLRI
jgi:hypothetical protein